MEGLTSDQAVGLKDILGLIILIDMECGDRRRRASSSSGCAISP